MSRWTHILKLEATVRLEIHDKLFVFDCLDSLRTYSDVFLWISVFSYYMMGKLREKRFSWLTLNNSIMFFFSLTTCLFATVASHVSQACWILLISVLVWQLMSSYVSDTVLLMFLESLLFMLVISSWIRPIGALAGYKMSISVDSVSYLCFRKLAPLPEYNQLAVCMDHWVTLILKKTCSWFLSWWTDI